MPMLYLILPFVIISKKNRIFYYGPVDSKDGHKRTSSHYLTFADPTTCATGYSCVGIEDILEF
jgi:hypothetical protein